MLGSTGSEAGQFRAGVVAVNQWRKASSYPLRGDGCSLDRSCLPRFSVQLLLRPLYQAEGDGRCFSLTHSLGIRTISIRNYKFLYPVSGEVSIFRAGCLDELSRVYAEFVGKIPGDQLLERMIELSLHTEDML